MLKQEPQEFESPKPYDTRLDAAGAFFQKEGEAPSDIRAEVRKLMEASTPEQMDEFLDLVLGGATKEEIRQFKLALSEENRQSEQSIRQQMAHGEANDFHANRSEPVSHRPDEEN